MGHGHIVAMGGGGFSMEPDNPLLDRYVLELTGRARPRVCFVPTASGDADGYIVGFYTAFAAIAEATHLPLFRRDGRSLEEVIGGQDVVYVGGGNTANLLAIWRTHGLDVLLRRFWQRGGVLCGLSAGALCWFEAGVTDSFGPLAALDGGLGLLAGSFCPHYDGEAERRPAYRALVGDARLAEGYAADDGAALHFEGTSLAAAVTSRPAARAYRVRRDPAAADGAVEEPLPVRYLGA